jgi:hypothetical protein
MPTVTVVRLQLFRAGLVDCVDELKSTSLGERWPAIWRRLVPLNDGEFLELANA